VTGLVRKSSPKASNMSGCSRRNQKNASWRLQLCPAMIWSMRANTAGKVYFVMMYVLCSAKTRSLLQSDRFPKDFRSEMLKRHVTLIDLAEVVQALRGDD